MGTLSTRTMTDYETGLVNAHDAGQHNQGPAHHCPLCMFSGRLVNHDGTVTTIRRLTVWRADGSGGSSGDFDYATRAAKHLREEGAVRVESGDRPWAHNVIGCGAGHNDADFAETGRSHAAWEENRPADPSEQSVWRGPWWDDSTMFPTGTRKDFNRIDGSLYDPASVYGG